MREIISHLYQDKNDGHWDIQSNEEHTKGVAELASRFANEFGMASWGKVLGMLHDKGKESNAFQQHIKKESGYKPDIKVTGDFHHAYVGGIIARNLYGKSADNFFVNQILSHHSGLHDSDELSESLNKNIPPEINQNVDRILPNKISLRLESCDFHHLSRMLYSCLVDADYLDTEAFMDEKSSLLRKQKKDLKDLQPLLDKYLVELKKSAVKSNVNAIREQIQQQCLLMADTPIGFYSLTVPTGGGKTLSSLLWAMRHAIKNGQKRIIIAIPYTSIIMQTADTLRKIFGDENVLEHHSNVYVERGYKNKSSDEEERDETYDELRERLKLATENWDYPIIVTTNVQLFESIFSNKPSKCRKLHNIVNSVIILDEVQTLSMYYLRPIVDSLKTYNKLFNASFLFTTASQPNLSGWIEGCNHKVSFYGIEKITEIIPDDLKLYDKLRRVKLEFNNDEKSYDELAAKLCQHKRVLCIVNTRKDAKELFDRLTKEGVTLHLSKMMCPAHISETIENIKTALKDEKNEIIRVVSTQLVEAGVDIDFPVVYRQEAGLDSLLQAAGRCNREGKNCICTTYVFCLKKEQTLSIEYISKANSARLNMVNINDWFAPHTMSEYFRQVYHQYDNFDKKNMQEKLYIDKITENINFESAAKDFQLIEDAGKNVIVCWKNSIDLLQVLHDKPSYSILKKLSIYTVNVHEKDFKALKEMGVVKELFEGIYVVEYKEQYDEHIGLRIDNNWTNKSLII